MEAPSFEKNMADLNDLVSRMKALMMAVDKERPYFLRDYDTKDRERIIATFGEIKPKMRINGGTELILFILFS
jgi:hypothetical protein